MFKWTFINRLFEITIESKNLYSIALLFFTKQSIPNTFLSYKTISGTNFRVSCTRTFP